MKGFYGLDNVDPLIIGILPKQTKLKISIYHGQNKLSVHKPVAFTANCSLRYLLVWLFQDLSWN